MIAAEVDGSIYYTDPLCFLLPACALEGAAEWTYGQIV